MAGPRSAEAIVAVATFLQEKNYPCQDVLGAFEGVGESADTWWCVVLAKPYEEEWQLYIVWPAGDPKAPAGDYDSTVNGMIIRSHGNELSHAGGVLAAMGVATGITYGE